MTGTAKSSRNCTTRIIQVNTGILNRVMPGARMLSTVMIRFMAEISERYADDLEADGVEVHAVARRERHARVG